MGVNELWRILEPAAETQSFKDYALTQSILRGERRGTAIAPIVVGIDASIWLHQCQAVFSHRRHGQMGQNPELRVLFHRLAALLDCPVIPVFVFDGPGRPAIKRGKAVRIRGNWMSRKFQDMIEAFGFYWHLAPGEAEAELASLNALQIFHAIMSEDSDSFVFGATEVIRRANVSDKKSDRVKIYSSTRCEMISSISLTRAGFILIALLRGGDYDHGLRGCGINTAHALAKYSSLGESLKHALEDYSFQHLPEFLHGWRDSLRAELSANKSGYLEQCHPMVGGSISQLFPDIAVARRYMNPLVSWSDGRQVQTVGGSDWTLQLPEMDLLFRLCDLLFSWGGADSILKKFRSILWHGFCLRQLVLFSHGDMEMGNQLARHSFSHVRPSRRQGPIQYYLVDVDLREVLALRFPLPERERNSLMDKFSRFTAIIPIEVVTFALPNLVHNMSKSEKVNRNINKRKRTTGTQVMETASFEPIDLTVNEQPLQPLGGKEIFFLGFIDLSEEEDPGPPSSRPAPISLGFIDLTVD